MEIIKSNPSCSKINVPIVKQKDKLDVYDITDELDYDSNRINDWRFVDSNLNKK